jgi:hypothetical protein
LATVSRKVKPEAITQTPKSLAGIKQNPPHRHHQQSGNDSTLVAKPSCQPSSRQRHEKVPKVVRKLHPGRLGFAQVQFILKVLIHHVDHPVANSPEQKKRANQDEGEEDVPAILRDKKALFV